MMRTNVLWRSAALALASAALAVAILSGCVRESSDSLTSSQSASRVPNPPASVGLFSWNSLDGEQLTEPRPVLNLMDQVGIDALYQKFSSEDELEEIGAFLAAAAENSKKVYYLSGDPAWGLDESGEEMLRRVELAAEIHQACQPGKGLQGIVMDVEPYLTSKWEDDPEEVMDRFVRAMETAYSAAKDSGLEMILCIPYFYDTKGFERHLETLIQKGCDTVAVMNYYKGMEAEHLETEAALAKKHGKGVITIYELQEPGKHDLTEKNTYYHDGVEAVWQSWQSVEAEVSYPGLGYAYHDIDALEEVLADE